MVEIYAVNTLVKSEKNDYEYLLSCVSEEKREIIRNRKNPKASIGTLYGEVLARLAIMERLGIKNREIQFERREHGKPYLVGHDQIFFNVSHSGDWVVCAIGDHEVGIDIEKMKSNRVNVAKRFFAEEEYQEILKQPEDQQTSYFSKLWTLKECYLKWNGKGLSVPLDSFCFYWNHVSEQFELRGGSNQNIDTQSANLRFRQYVIDRDYQLSVCSCEEFNENIHVMDDREIIRRMEKGAMDDE